MTTYNKYIHGKPFHKDTIDRIWNKGKIVPEYDPSIWRWDRYKTLIRYSDYKKPYSKYGWVIGYLKPKLTNGLDEHDNLQPVHWKNQR